MAYNRLEQVAGLEALPCLLHLDVSGNSSIMQSAVYMRLEPAAQVTA